MTLPQLAALLIAPIALMLPALTTQAAPIEGPDLPLTALESDDVKPQAVIQTDKADDVTFPELGDARQAFLAGDVEKCLQSLRAAVAKQPDLPTPRIALARMHTAEGQHAQARRALEQCATDDLLNPDVYLAFAELAIAEMQFTDAAVHFEKALSLDAPEHWQADRRQRHRAHCYVGLAAIAEQRGHWAKAQEHLNKLVQINPHDAKLRDRWAKSLFLVGREESAFEQYDIAYQQDPSVNPPEVSMGARSTRAGKFAEANQWYDKALAGYPDNAAIHFEFSVALMCQDRPHEADRHAQHAKEKGVDSVPLRLHLAQIAWQLKNYVRARLLLTELLEQHPNMTAAQDLLALVDVSTANGENHDRALALARKNVKQNPDAAKLLATLGWVEFQTGHAAEAANHLREAIKRDGHPQTLYFAAVVLDKQDGSAELDRVVFQLQREVAQPCVFPLRDEAKQWLQAYLDR